MYFPRSFPRVALALALVGITPAAALAAPSAKEKAEARALVENAKKALKEKRFADAMTALGQASKLDPGPAMEIELAQAEIASGKLVDASKRLTAVASAEGDGSAATKAARDAAKKANGEIVGRIPSVKVNVTGAAGKVTVTLDGGPATPGSDESVNPGEHTVVVSPEGGKPVERKVTVAEGAHETVEVALDAGASPAESSGSSSIMPRVPGIAVTGAGVVMMAIGGIFGGLAFGAAKDAKAGCTNDVCTDSPELQDKISKSRTFGNVSTGLLVGGGIVTAGGVVLFILAPGAKKKDDAKAARIAPWFGPDQIGVTGSF